MFYFFQIDSQLVFAKISSFSFTGKNILKKKYKLTRINIIKLATPDNFPQTTFPNPTPYRVSSLQTACKE